MCLKLLPYEILKGKEQNPTPNSIDFLCPESGLDLCIYKRGSDAFQHRLAAQYACDDR